MTTSKISALTDLGAAPASTDLVPIVDVSDTTQAASGSTKKNLVSDFFSWLLATARVFTAKPTFAGGIAIRDTGDDHLITIDTATNEAADRSITIPALGANVTLSFLDLAQTFTAQNTFNTGSAGANAVKILRDGTAEETQIYQDSTGLHISNNNGVSYLKRGTSNHFGVDGSGSCSFTGGGSLYLLTTTTTINMGSGVSLKASSTASPSGGAVDIGLSRAAAGVWRVTNGSTGGGVIEFGEVADVPTPSSNSANIGAEDVAGTAEIICADEGGTETQQTEHRSDGPAWLYDDVAVTGMLDRIEYDRQRYLGVHRYYNLSRERRLRVAGTPITTAPGLPTTCEFVETFVQWHARCPEKAVIQKRDWDTDQAAKQAKYDADRQAELDAVAKVQAEHAKALSDYAKLSPAEKAKRPAPVAPELPAVRDAKSVKKPKPEWLK